MTQQGDKLVGTGAVGAAVQGTSVALSAEGRFAIVGGPNDNTNTGAAWVFTRSEGVWTQQGDKLVGTGAVGSAVQGTSVALSAEGRTAIVGGPNDNTNSGAAWVFARRRGVWTQQGNKLAAPVRQKPNLLPSLCRARLLHHPASLNCRYSLVSSGLAGEPVAKPYR